MKGAELAAFEREDRIWQLRLQEKSYREIGEEVGLSHVQVGNILNARLATMVTPRVSEYRHIETEKLALLEKCFWPKAEQGDYSAGNIILKVRERFARLWGLDAPQQMALDIHDTNTTWGRIYDSVLTVD